VKHVIFEPGKENVYFSTYPPPTLLHLSHHFTSALKPAAYKPFDCCLIHFRTSVSTSIGTPCTIHFECSGWDLPSNTQQGKREGPERTCSTVPNTEPLGHDAATAPRNGRLVINYVVYAINYSLVAKNEPAASGKFR
jgi:hypothetical protein